MVHDGLHSKAIPVNRVRHCKDVFPHHIQAIHIEFAAHFFYRSLETLLAGLFRERGLSFYSGQLILDRLEKPVLEAELPLNVAHVANLSLRIPPENLFLKSVAESPLLSRFGLGANELSHARSGGVGDGKLRTFAAVRATPDGS